MLPRKLWLPALAMLALAVALALPGKSAQAASPSDGVYDVAILQVGSYTDWFSDQLDKDPQDDDLAAMDQAPGIFDHDHQFIDTSDLTTSVLDDFDVLIIPWAHNYCWLEPDMAAAIMKFVADGGILLIHSVKDGCGEEDITATTLPEGFPDDLLAFFGDGYNINWIDPSGDHVIVIDPTNPLVAVPNMLTEEALSNWSSSIHSTVVSFGSQWHWATATDFQEGEVEPSGLTTQQASQSNVISAQAIVPEMDQAFVSGCAPFGRGVIVVSGQDPEYHDFNNPEEGAYQQIENEVTLGQTGCFNETGRGSDNNQRPQPPNIGGALAGLFAQGQPTPLPTTRPATGSGTGNVVISPPNTGDAGLADGSHPSEIGIALAGITLFTLAGLSGLRLLRR